jgi:hypothetical protein
MLPKWARRGSPLARLYYIQFPCKMPNSASRLKWKLSRSTNRRRLHRGSQILIFGCATARERYTLFIEKHTFNSQKFIWGDVKICKNRKAPWGMRIRCITHHIAASVSSLHIYTKFIYAQVERKIMNVALSTVDLNAEEVGRLAQVFCRQAKRDRFYRYCKKMVISIFIEKTFDMNKISFWIAEWWLFKLNLHVSFDSFGI